MTDEVADRSRELLVAQRLAAWAAERIRSSQPTEVTTKEHAADLVTETDRLVERRVREVLAEEFPDQVVVGEEYGGEPAGDGGPTWYLDPVDGTTNYASGLPWSSFSLALADADGVAVGVVADPWRGETFSAERGGAAYRDGVPIRCADVSSLAGQVVLTEWASYRPWPGMHAFLERMSEAMVTTRIMGSSALSLTSVAAGRAAAGVIGDFHPVDLLASVLIAERAGAVVCDEAGTRTLMPARGGVLVAAPGVWEAVWSAWRSV